jgi:hypothetical protein
VRSYISIPPYIWHLFSLKCRSNFTIYKLLSSCFCKGLWQWSIQYTNVTLNILHYLWYI